jgi:hypothetical protein
MSPICRLSPDFKVKHGVMMRLIISVALLLAGCSQEPAGPSLKVGTFAGEGRDRLCLAGSPGAYRAGLIAYGEGDMNCSAAGKLEPAGSGWTLTPKGEGECRILLTVEADVVHVGQVPATCAYYCGPGAALTGKSYNRADMGAKAVDLAGDPLC